MKEGVNRIYDRSWLAGGSAAGKKVGDPRGLIQDVGEPKLTIRVIGRCNFRCPVCSTFSSPEREGRLSLGDFKRAVEILREARFRGVVNLSGGEPFLHPRLPEMVSYLSRRLPRAKIVLFTNGYWARRPHWKGRLEKMLGHPNLLLRFSLDRQHIEGVLLASPRGGKRALEEIKAGYFEKAGAFRDYCLALGARPGTDFDFAFKGTIDEAKSYMKGLGPVPIYPIKFQKNPRRRQKEFGYMAIDLGSGGRPMVYSTLGHLSRAEPLGGLDHLKDALRESRAAIGRKKSS